MQTHERAYLDEPLLVREKLLLLGLVNTLQPIRPRELKASLPRSFEPELVGRILASLRNEGLVIRLANRRYTVTTKGRAVIGSGYFAKQCDIDRILGLFLRSKEGKKR